MGHGDELQDDVKIWCVRGEKGADMTEGGNKCGRDSGEGSRGLKVTAVREGLWYRIFRGLIACRYGEVFVSSV